MTKNKVKSFTDYPVPLTVTDYSYNVNLISDGFSIDGTFLPFNPGVTGTNSYKNITYFKHKNKLFILGLAYYNYAWGKSDTIWELNLDTKLWKQIKKLYQILYKLLAVL